jgi:hypothetical protein
MFTVNRHFTVKSTVMPVVTVNRHAPLYKKGVTVRGKIDGKHVQPEPNL